MSKLVVQNSNLCKEKSLLLFCRPLLNIDLPNERQLFWSRAAHVLTLPFIDSNLHGYSTKIILRYSRTYQQQI